jgi:hypothetical protein
MEMARICTVCNHSDVEEIDRRLVSGDSIAGIARDFAVSEDSLRRHFDNHVPETLAASPSTKDIINGDNLLDQLQSARDKAIELLDMAIVAGDTKVYGPPSSYLSEIRQQIKLWAELEGRISSQPQITIINNPEWVELRTAIIVALDPYPEAKAAVVHAISGR